MRGRHPRDSRAEMSPTALRTGSSLLRRHGSGGGVTGTRRCARRCIPIPIRTGDTGSTAPSSMSRSFMRHSRRSSLATPCTGIQANGRSSGNPFFFFFTGRQPPATIVPYTGRTGKDTSYLPACRHLPPSGPGGTFRHKPRSASPGRDDVCGRGPGEKQRSRRE